MAELDFPITGGVQQGVDPRVAPPVLTGAKNVRMLKAGRSGKRRGYEALGNNPSANLSAVRGAIAGVRDSRVVFAGDKFYAYSASLNTWRTSLETDYPAVAAPTRVPVARQRKIDNDVDGAQAGTFRAFVYTATGVGTYVVVLDQNGHEISRQLVTTDTGPQVQVRALGANFVIIWTTSAGTAIKNRILTISSPTISLGSVVTVANMSPGNQPFQTAEYSSTEYLLTYYSDPNIVIARCDGASITATRNHNIGAGLFPYLAVNGENQGSSEGIWVAWRLSAPSVSYAVMNNALNATTLGTTVIDTTAGILGWPTITREGVSTQRRIAWSRRVTTAAAETEEIMHRAWTIAGGGIATTETLPGYLLASQAFTYGGRAYVIASSSFLDFDRTYVLLCLTLTSGSTTIRGRRIAEACRGQAARYDTALLPPRLPGMLVSSSQFSFPALVIVNSGVTDAEGSTALEWSLDAVRFDFDSADACVPVVANDAITWGAGVVLSFDGTSMLEATPLEQSMIHSVVTGTSGSLGTGTYLYKTVNVFRNGRGQVVRGAPSPAFSVSFSSGAANHAVLSIKRYNSHFRKAHVLDDSGVSSIATEVYRTAANGSTYYLDQVIQTSSEPATGPLSATSTLPDASLTAKQVLYSQVGDASVNSPAPPFRYAATMADRLFVGGVEISNQVRWSKRFILNEGISWSDSGDFIGVIPDTVTGVAALDGQWFAFTASAVYVAGGDGPADDGSGAPFSAFSQVPSATGCTNAKSIVVGPVQVFYQGRDDRLYAIPRGGGAPSPVSEIQDYLTSYPRISGAALVPQEAAAPLVVFGAADSAGTAGAVIVYDTEHNAWGLDTYSAGLTSVIYGVARFANTVGLLTLNVLAFKISQQSAAGVYSDNAGGSGIVQEWITSSISVFGAAGWGRYKTVTIVGEHRGNCDLTLSISNDDGKTYSQVKTWTITGTAGDTIERQLMISRPRGSSIRLKLATDSNTTEGFVLNSFTIEHEQAAGTLRLGSGNRG